MQHKNYEVTGNVFKLIAVVTMLVDHIAVGIVLSWLEQPEVFYSPSYSSYVDMYHVMRNIGRMAFPIYCFMLVEGYFHTRNLKKYGLRLLQIAIISEIPFDLALRNGQLDISSNNVLWELLLGLIVIAVMDRVLHFSGGIFDNEIFKRVIMVAIMFLGMGIAYVTKLDYRHSGIACISVMYFLYGNTKESRMTGFGLGVLMLTFMSSRSELFAAAMLIPMYFYDGNKGSDSLLLRKFFYLFYPLHLTIIYLIKIFFMR